MAGEESRKRTRGSQQSSSGAAGPAPDPLFNPLGDYDLSMLRKRIDTLAKAQEPRDPIRRFAGESQSRIEQDLLMLESGIGTKELLRRLAIYTKLVFGPSAQHEEFARRYAERVGQASVYLGKRR